MSAHLWYYFIKMAQFEMHLSTCPFLLCLLKALLFTVFYIDLNLFYFYNFIQHLMCKDFPYMCCYVGLFHVFNIITALMCMVVMHFVCGFILYPSHVSR